MKNVLIVDDEKSFLMSLRQGLVPYENDFHTVTATNGKFAVEVLKTRPIDLIVTDLKMPEMDGFELLAYLTRNYSKIPVIVMSAYCTPEIRNKLKSIGSFKVLDKPIDFQEFVEQVFLILRADPAGFIHGISLPAFLHLIEMERKTCTLVITAQGKKGFLHFSEGALIDAEAGATKHLPAALDIVGWDDPVIEIASESGKKDISIRGSLEFIIMEGYRMRDERKKNTPAQPQPGPASAGSPPGAGGGDGAQNEETEHRAGRPVKEEKMATTKDILAELAKVPSVEAICLVARDGFLIDSNARSGIDKEMIGAIASSGFGASASMGKQLDKGSMQISMIEFEKGPVLFTPVGDDAFLVIVADKDANLGMIRLKLKKHSGELVLAAAL